MGCVEMDRGLCQGLWTFLLGAQPVLKTVLRLGWAGGKGNGIQPLAPGVQQP